MSEHLPKINGVRLIRADDHPHYIHHHIAPREPGYYTFGTRRRRTFDEFFLTRGWTICVACARENKLDSHVRPLAMHSHLLEAHGITMADYVRLYEGHHGFSAESLVGRVE